MFASIINTSYGVGEYILRSSTTGYSLYTWQAFDGLSSGWHTEESGGNTGYYTLDGSEPNEYSEIAVDRIMLPQQNSVLLRLYASNGVDFSPLRANRYSSEKHCHRNRAEGRQVFPVLISLDTWFQQRRFMAISFLIRCSALPYTTLGSRKSWQKQPKIF
jgi:hypothetical protein